MIIYNPTNGEAITSPTKLYPRHVFLMTRLGTSIPEEIEKMRKAIVKECHLKNFKTMDASNRITGRDFLVKIWALISTTPIAIGIIHEKMPVKTQLNIFYEIGIAQAMGKETIIVKSPNSEIPSDFVRTEYVTFDQSFRTNFSKYLDEIESIAEYYKTLSEQLDRNPVLTIDYLRRSYLINGNKSLIEKIKAIIADSGLLKRAKNSVELLAANF